jgi:nitrogen fixation protein FixH
MSSYRWIPWVIAAGLGVVVIVNGALAYFAETSSTGLVTEHPYESGREYNHVLAAAAASDALGWHGHLGFAAAPGSRSGELAVDITDRAGQPLRGLTVGAVIVSPVAPQPDARVELAEAGDGRYQATLALSRLGQWDVRIAARRGSDFFEFEQRIVVK